LVWRHGAPRTPPELGGRRAYYGADAGNKLTALLQQHIMTAAGMLKAAVLR
jgi:hypothetical protein